MQGLIALPQIQIDTIHSAHANTMTLGADTLAHAHGGELLVAVLAGQALVCAAEHEWLLAPGQLLVLHPTASVRLTALVADSKCLRLSFNATASNLMAVFGRPQATSVATQAALSDLWTQITTLHHLRTGKPDLVYDVERADLYQLASSLVYAQLTTVLLQCAAKAANTHYHELRTGTAAPVLPASQDLRQLYHQIVVNQVIDYMTAHLATPLTVGALAAHFDIGESLLKRQFKAATKQSVMAYFKTLRLKEAKRLVTETQLPFTQIAQQTGFQRLAHFSAAFKQVYGQSPTEARSAQQHVPLS